MLLGKSKTLKTNPAKVLVKIASPPHLGAHEALIMDHIRRTPPYRPSCRRGRSLVPALHIPILYAHGLYGDQYVLIMEFIPGKSLASIEKPTQPMKRMFEQAVLSIWAAGVVHADLHFNNVIIQPGRVVIIDFGMAVLLSGPLAMKLRQKICTPDGALDDPEIFNTVIAHQQRAKRTIVHLNTWALRDMAYRGVQKPRRTLRERQRPPPPPRQQQRPTGPPPSRTGSQQYKSPFNF